MAVRIGVVSAIALGFAECHGEVPPRRGPFAFHYSAEALSEEALLWYSQFDLLVTHDPLPPDQVKRLHAAGTKLLFYEWAVAFYESRATVWQKSLQTADLLNTSALTGGVGSDTAAAWYFDPASPSHASGRAGDLLQRLESTGYDGIFLDTTTFESVHPVARLEYERRHPDTAYDAAFARFLAEIRRQEPTTILFTNQGYRKPEHYLPHVDWDLTESLITRSGPRPWNEPADPWNSIHFVMTKMIVPVMQRYPHVRFGHLNYAGDGDRASIRLVVATAQLFGGEGFAASPSLLEEADPIYFRDPGKPMGPRIDAEGGKVSYRFFSHGLIVVTASEEEITIGNERRVRLRNRETGEIACDTEIVIPATAAPRAWFFDRVSTCVSAGDAAR